MTNKAELISSNRTVGGVIAGWVAGSVFLAIGLINTFWGNDPGYGVFVVLLSFVFFPGVTALIRRGTGVTISLLIKIMLGLFIIWTALGVGELFDKISLMVKDF